MDGSAQVAAVVAKDSGGASFSVTLEGADGPYFLWALSLSDQPFWQPMGVGTLDAGSGTSAVHVAGDFSTASTLYDDLVLRAFFLRDGVVVTTEPGTLQSEDEEPLGDPFDFDWSAQGEALAAGTVVSDVQPWSSFMNISAINADPEHPSKAILLDSADPETEPGLMTPGFGAGNHEPLGALLVIAASDRDLDGDGLVDEPQAEPAGGTLVFDFPGRSATFFFQLVDVDDGPATVRWYDGSELLGTEVVPPGEDNSVFETSGQFGVTRVEIELSGSAGVGGLTLYPCETVIGFDHLSTGVPVDFAAGDHMTFGEAPQVMLAALGLFLTAQNANPTHPDAALLFDSAAPTGDDDDLATPGDGIGNDEALGKVLILAEDDVDADEDGLVDDPDDELAGGVIELRWFTSSARFRGATVLDVDHAESSWVEVVLDDGSGSVAYPLQNLGDNSVQTLEVDAGPTRLVRFHLGGSAAIAEIRICPIY